MADVLEQIKVLPQELQDKILKEYIKNKIQEREDLGWVDVIYSLIAAPFCEINEQTVKVSLCNEWLSGEKYLCNLCMRKGRRHYIENPIY